VPSLAAQSAFLDSIQAEIEQKLAARLAIDGQVFDQRQALELSHGVLLIYGVHGRCESDAPADRKSDLWLFRSSDIAGILNLPRCELSGLRDGVQPITYCHTPMCRTNLRLDKSKRLLHWEVVLSEEPSKFKDAAPKRIPRAEYVPGARRSRTSLTNSPGTNDTPQVNFVMTPFGMTVMPDQAQAQARKPDQAQARMPDQAQARCDSFAAQSPDKSKAAPEEALEIRRELAASRSEYTALREEFEKVTAESLAFKAKFAEAEADIALAREAKSAQDAAAVKEAAASTALRDELAARTASVKQAEAELAKVKAEAEVNAKVKAEAEVNAVELAKAKAEAEVSAVELAKAKAEAEAIADSLRDAAVWETKKVEKERKRCSEAAAAETEDLREEIAALKADADKARSGDESGLQLELATLREQLVEFEARSRESEALQKDYETLQTEHASLKDRAEVAEREAAALRKCEAALVASEVKARAMSEELNGANEVLAQMKVDSTAAAAAKKHMKTLIGRLAEMEELVSVLQEQLVIANARNADVEELVVTARQESETLRNELQAAEAALRKCTCGDMRRCALAAAAKKEVSGRSEIGEGTTLVCMEEADVFESLTSWHALATLLPGNKVTAAAAPIEHDGFTMIPILPTGVVEASGFQQVAPGSGSEVGMEFEAQSNAEHGSAPSAQAVCDE